MLDPDKQNIVRGSDYFSERIQKHEIKQTSIEKENKNPFVTMASSGKLEDELYVAKNPNAPAEALLIISQSKNFKNNKELQTALAAHKNTPQKVLDILPKKILEKEAHKRENIKYIKKASKEGLNSKNETEIGEVSSGAYSKQLSYEQRYAEAAQESIKEFYDDPNISKEQKEAAKKAGIQYRKQKQAEQQEKQQQKKKEEENRNNLLKKAKSGDFSEITIPEDMSSLSQEDKRVWNEVNRLKKNKEKKEEQQKKKDEIAASKKGEVSEENIKRGRALNFLVEGMDKKDRKDVSSDIKQEMEHLNKLAEAKRREELKKAKKGDFSGIETPEKNEPLSNADIAHYKEIEKLKKQDQLKRARKGDFSGTEIPSDTTNMSKEEKRHYTELEKLKKQKEEKDKRKEEKDKREAKRKEKQQKEEAKSPKPQARQNAPMLDPRSIVRTQLNQSRENLANLSRQDAAEQMQALRVAAMAGGSEAAQALKDLRSGGGTSSSAALAYMSDIQAQINRQAGAADPSQPNKPLENTGAMTQSTSITKLQPNTHRLNISEDRITEMNIEYQQVPEFKRVLA